MVANHSLQLASVVSVIIGATAIAYASSPIQYASYHTNPKQYPHHGDLYYTGTDKADAYMNWHAPGRWQSSDKAVEIDIDLAENYFDSCTIATDLPINYDDCPTAGVGDPAGRRVFGMGTFDGTQLVPGQWYRGYWYFQGGSAEVSYANKTWGEVTRQICGDRYDIWCYGQVAGSVLMRTDWVFGQTAYMDYLHED